MESAKSSCANLLKMGLDGYECGGCGKVWNTAEKNMAVEKGCMVAREVPDYKPRKVGYHLNRLYSLLGKSGDIPKLVADFIDAMKSGDPKKLQGFVNSALAEPWRQTVVKTEESEILKARCTLPPQTVPVDCRRADMRNRHAKARFLVRRARLGAGLSLMARALRLFADLGEHRGLAIRESAYPIDGKDGLSLGIWRAGIDTGGGAGAYETDPTLTEQAYYWIRKNGVGRGCLCYATKGSSHPLAGKVHHGKRQSDGGYAPSYNVQLSTQGIQPGHCRNRGQPLRQRLRAAHWGGRPRWRRTSAQTGPGRGRWSVYFAREHPGHGGAGRGYDWFVTRSQSELGQPTTAAGREREVLSG